MAGVELVQDLSRISPPTEGFLRRYRHRVKSVLSDGQRTETFVVDYVDRTPERRDAVVVAAYQPAPSGDPGEVQVLLRRQLRYPVQVVLGQPLFLEAVAGILEGDEPVVRAAARELFEEAGLDLPAHRFKVLGQPFFPSPGILTERIHVVAAALDPGALERPLHPAPTDGSAMEQGAELVSLTLDDALRLSEVPASEPIYLADAKTELALRRLAVALTRETTP